MDELFKRIIAWGEDKFTGLEYEPLPQIGFLIEELHEVNKEFIKGNIDAAVGEIADIIVFSVNALVLLKGDFDKNFDYFDKSDGSFKIIVAHLLQRIGFISSVFNFNKSYIINGYDGLICQCIAEIKSLGYNPELALMETVKKIESREGAFNLQSGKWEKTATHYKPDYSIAKLTKDKK